VRLGVVPNSMIEWWFLLAGINQRILRRRRVAAALDLTRNEMDDFQRTTR